MKYKVKPGQNLFDLAIIMTGSADNAFELARVNGLSITTALKGGEILEWETGKEPPSGRALATAYRPDGEENDIGIGEMIIEQTFIVH